MDDRDGSTAGANASFSHVVSEDGNGLNPSEPIVNANDLFCIQYVPPKIPVDAFVDRDTHRRNENVVKFCENIPPSDIGLALGFAQWWKDSWKQNVEQPSKFSNLLRHRLLNFDRNRVDGVSSKGDNSIMSVFPVEMPTSQIFARTRSDDVWSIKNREAGNRNDSITNSKVSFLRDRLAEENRNSVMISKNKTADDFHHEDASKTKVSRIFSSFAERTSLPAASFLSRSNGLSVRVAWALLVLTLFAGLTCHLILLVSSFVSYQKFTEVSLGFQPLDFPAVTVCNVNPARFPKIHLASKQLQTLVRNIKPLNLVTKMKLIHDVKRLATDALIAQGLDPDDINASIENLDAIIKGIEERPKFSRSKSENRIATTDPSDPFDGASLTDMMDQSAEQMVAGENATPTPPSMGVPEDTKKLNNNMNNLPRLTSRIRRSRSLRDNVAQNVNLGSRRSVPSDRRQGEEIESPTTTTQANYEDTSVEAAAESSTQLTDNATTTLAWSTTTPGNESLAAGNDSDIADDFVPLLEDVSLNFTNVKRKVQRVRLGKTAFERVSMSTAIIDEFKYLFSRENRSKRVEMGHQLEDMLVDCSFDGSQCYPSNFTLLASATFGNCYTIDHPTMVAQLSGYGNGLSLVLFLEPKAFLAGLTSSTGGHLILHPKNTFPFPESEGLAVPAGMEVDIGIKLININRLGQPYGDCYDSETNTSFDITYTLQSCQHFCEQKLFLSECGCYLDEDEEIVRYFGSYLDDASHPCSTEEELQCLYEIRDKHLKDNLVCDCKNPCHEMVYSKSLSMRQWPTEEYGVILANSICRRLSQEDCRIYKALTPEEFATSFMKLNIFYEDLNYENITEKPSYTSTQFFSDMGGTLGLWLGLSMVTLCEIGHLVVSLVRVPLRWL